MSRAVIGLDGLDPRDIEKYGFDGEWDELEIETVAHTAPSWNSIFSGRPRDEEDRIYDFWECPSFVAEEAELVSKSDCRFDYEDIVTDDFVWEGEDVDVVSAPVCFPTYSNIDNPPGIDLTWPTGIEELSECIDTLTEMTAGRERVVTVFSVPDKMHHKVDNEGRYDEGDRELHMEQINIAMGALTAIFDKWIILSDHGRPGVEEYVHNNLWVKAHEPTGVVRSNVVDTDGYTNVSINEQIQKVLFE